MILNMRVLKVNISLLIVCDIVSLTLGRRCMECFQCISSLSEVFPSCDDYYWHILTQKKKEAMIVGCVPEESDFCVKIEKNITGERLTQRGCHDLYDSKGNKLKKGCFSYEEHDTTNKICLCSHSLCNLGSTLHFLNFTRFVYFISFIVMKQSLQ